jgi:hypothetical protein
LDYQILPVINYKFQRQKKFRFVFFPKNDSVCAFSAVYMKKERAKNLEKCSLNGGVSFYGFSTKTRHKLFLEENVNTAVRLL